MALTLACQLLLWRGAEGRQAPLVLEAVVEPARLLQVLQAVLRREQKQAQRPVLCASPGEEEEARGGHYPRIAQGLAAWWVGVWAVCSLYYLDSASRCSSSGRLAMMALAITQQ